jgi:hypothetical protein
MSEPSPVPMHMHRGPSAAVPRFRPALRVVEPVRAVETSPTPVAPRSIATFDRMSSLHEPAPRATIAAATALAIVVAVAGVVVALSLSGGVVSLDVSMDVSMDAESRAAPPPAASASPSSWHHGWGSLPRAPQQQRHH